MPDADCNPLQWSWRRLALATALVAAMLATAWIAYHCVDVLLLLFVAILLSTALMYPVNWMEQLGASHALAVVMVHLVAIGLLLGGILFVWPLAAHQTNNLVDSLPGRYQQLRTTIERADFASSQDLAEALPAELDDVFRNGPAWTSSHVFSDPWIAIGEALWATFLPLATIPMAEEGLEGVLQVLEQTFRLPQSEEAAG